MDLRYYYSGFITCKPWHEWLVCYFINEAEATNIVVLHWVVSRTYRGISCRLPLRYLLLYEINPILSTFPCFRAFVWEGRATFNNTSTRHISHVTVRNYYQVFRSKILGWRHKFGSAQSVNCSFLNSIWRKIRFKLPISSSDKKMSERSFISSENCFEILTFSKFNITG